MDASTSKKFVREQWKTLIVLMVGYICYYFLRKNFSAAYVGVISVIPVGFDSATRHYCHRGFGFYFQLCALRNEVHSFHLCNFCKDSF